MTSNRFYIDRSGITDDSAVIPGDEHHHLTRVARIRVKDIVWLFDKFGTSYRVRVENIGTEETRCAIMESIEPETPAMRITLGQVVLKYKPIDILNQFWNG